MDIQYGSAWRHAITLHIEEPQFHSIHVHFLLIFEVFNMHFICTRFSAQKKDIYKCQAILEHNLTAWSTNVLSTYCQPVTKGHNWHIDYLSVVLFCHGEQLYLTCLCAKQAVALWSIIFIKSDKCSRSYKYARIVPWYRYNTIITGMSTE